MRRYGGTLMFFDMVFIALFWALLGIFARLLSLYLGRRISFLGGGKLLSLRGTLVVAVLVTCMYILVFGYAPVTAALAAFSFVGTFQATLAVLDRRMSNREKQTQ